MNDSTQLNLNNQKNKDGIIELLASHFLWLKMLLISLEKLIK